MRKVKALGAVCVVALAFGAVSASNVLAVGWLLNGAAIVTNVPFHGEGRWLLLGLSLFGFVKTHFVCSVKISGTVGPGAAGQITKIEGLKGETGAITCENLHGELGGCSGSLLGLHTFKHLPWNMKLETGIKDTLESSGSGEPAASIECTLSGGSKSTKECEGNITSNNLINGASGVEAEVSNVLSKPCRTSGTVFHWFFSWLFSSSSGTLSVS
jgi:hypothetical protein